MLHKAHKAYVWDMCSALLQRASYLNGEKDPLSLSSEVETVDFSLKELLHGLSVLVWQAEANDDRRFIKLWLQRSHDTGNKYHSFYLEN